MGLTKMVTAMQFRPPRRAGHAELSNFHAVSLPRAFPTAAIVPVRRAQSATVQLYPRWSQLWTTIIQPSVFGRVERAASSSRPPVTGLRIYQDALAGNRAAQREVPRSP